MYLHSTSATLMAEEEEGIALFCPDPMSMKPSPVMMEPRGNPIVALNWVSKSGRVCHRQNQWTCVCGSGAQCKGRFALDGHYWPTKMIGLRRTFTKSRNLSCRSVISALPKPQLDGNSMKFVQQEPRPKNAADSIGRLGPMPSLCQTGCGWQWKCRALYNPTDQVWEGRIEKPSIV